MIGAAAWNCRQNNVPESLILFGTQTAVPQFLASSEVWCFSAGRAGSSLTGALGMLHWERGERFALVCMAARAGQLWWVKITRNLAVGEENALGAGSCAGLPKGAPILYLHLRG